MNLLQQFNHNLVRTAYKKKEWHERVFVVVICP